MPNPLYNTMNKNVNNQGNIIEQFQKFKNSYGNIDPKQEVQKLVNSGRISQAQLNQLQSMAQQFMNFANKK